MRYVSTSIPGVLRLEPKPHVDERGTFARAWDRAEAVAHGMNGAIEQVSISTNLRRGTLRGLHYQLAPFGEDKLVRCVRGAIFDVVVDCRRGSPRYGCWEAHVLSASEGVAVYLPANVAHGFQTLENDSDVLYQIAHAYRPDAARGIRWNDPVLAITWPIPNPILSERDAGLPGFEAAE
jgi:dTDP-4-dehydrorhamnose 3,5-epimerase